MKLNHILLLLAALFCLFLVSILEGLLLSFGFSFLIAWMLSPAYNRLHKWGVPTHVAASLMVFAFVLMVGCVCFLAAPFFISRLQILIYELPGIYNNHIATTIIPWVSKIAPQKNFVDAVTLSPDSMMTYGLRALSTILASGAAVANAFTLVILTPIVAYFALSRWPIITGTLLSLFPPRRQSFIQDIFTRISRQLGTYVRGQSLVAIILAIFYTISFSLMGLKAALSLGLFIGLLSFIPYVGFLLGFLGATAQLVSQGALDAFPLLCLIFAVIQAVESFVLSPQLVGEKLGLNPAWCLFMLFASGTLFGFLGLLLAYPFAAIIQLLSQEAFQRYQQTTFYMKKAS
ncbi:AI-2E family transporter [Alphaproteobacteria bacterium]|nr:AI-2E family transporter [Alphaproteobacteria bacterium]